MRPTVRRRRGHAAWWVASALAAASMLILHSGAHASRRAPDDAWPGVAALLRERGRAESPARPEDAGILRERYESLQERRRDIETALPKRLTGRPAARRTALRGSGVAEPPRMDSGDPNPDGLRFFPAAGAAEPGGGR